MKVFDMNSITRKTKEFQKNLREEIISSHLKSLGYKISKRYNTPRDGIVSVIRKFKTYGTTANLPDNKKPTG